MIPDGDYTLKVTHVEVEANAMRVGFEVIAGLAATLHEKFESTYSLDAIAQPFLLRFIMACGFDASKGLDTDALIGSIIRAKVTVDWGTPNVYNEEAL
jgi:hypothetical protein